MKSNYSDSKEKKLHHNDLSSEMVRIPAGTFTMGSDFHYPEELPSQKVTAGGFWIDKYLVTNEEIKRLVDETVYITVAERTINPEDYLGIPLCSKLENEHLLCE